MQILYQVRGADDDRGQPGVAASDHVQAQETQRRFRHGPKGQVGRRARGVQRLGQRGELFGRLHFG